MRPNYNSKTQKRKRQRHDFLLTFFEEPHKYEVKEVNGYFLTRQFNKGNGKWEVAIYSEEKWEKVQKWKQKQELNQADLL